MNFEIRDIQICGRSGYVFTDNKNPQIAVLTEGGKADSIEITVFHDGVRDWFISGKDKIYYTYAGQPLKAKTHYGVLVKAVKGCKESICQAEFDTGFLDEKWAANWIEPVQDSSVLERKIKFYETFMPYLKTEFHPENLRPAQIVRKKVNIENIPEKAVIYATTHGIYELKVNSVSVDSRRLAPEISSYDKRLYYQRYDIREFLVQGENTVEFIIADGWWCGRIGLVGASCQYGNRLGLLAQIELQENGRTRVIGSDESFEGKASDIIGADLYIGEKRDLTFKGGEWKPCEVAAYPMDNLKAQELIPLTETGNIKGRLFITPKGDILADFGQTVAGVVRLTADASGTRTVRVEHSEVLDKDGEFFQNIVGRNKQQRDVCICDSWPQSFQPSFTYHGFRYVRITGLELSEIKNVEAVIIGTPIDFYGDFNCSDERLNQLQNNIKWSMKGNFFSIPTDCPQREKMGWTGDIQVFIATALLNADVRGFIRNWLTDMRLEQRENGEVPNYIPNFPINDETQRESQGDNTSSAWGDASILVPLAIYNMDGDKDVLRCNLEMMKKWLDFVAKMTACMPEDYDSFPEDKKQRYKYLWHAGHHFGDWLIPSFMNRPKGIVEGVNATAKVISSAFYAITLEAYINVLQAVDADEDRINEIAELLENVRNAVREEYVSENGLVEGDLQGLYVIILKSKAVSGKLKEAVAARLAEKIRENGNRLDTGFVTTPYLLEVLCENGYSDLAYELLYQTNEPSWLYQVEKGATTIWENWTAIKPDGTVTESSMNHYALGCIGSFMMSHIGGIREIDLKNEKILFQPDLNCRLSSASARTKIPYGTVSIKWTRDEAMIKLNIISPLPCCVRVGEQQTELDAGMHELRIDIA